MQVFTRIIRQLLDELESSEDLQKRVAELEQWKEKVEAAWPQIVEDV